MPYKRPNILVTLLSARVVSFLFILFICSFSFSSPAELTKAKSELKGIVTSSAPEEINHGVQQFVSDFDKDRTTNTEFTELMRYLKTFLKSDQPAYVDALFTAGDRLQRESLFKEAYSFLYPIARIEEKDGSRVQHICRFYEVMGHSYFFFGRLKKAEEMFQKGIQCGNLLPENVISMLNTMGLIYNRYQKMEEAESYFIRAAELAEKENNEAWFGVISGNLGSLYFIKEDVENARKHLTIDFDLSSHNNQWSSAINALSLLAQVDLSTGEVEEASQKMSMLDSLMQLYSSEVSPLEYYRAKTDFSEYIGDFQQALTNYRLQKKYQDSMRSASDLTTIKNVEFQLEFERKQSEILSLQQKRKADNIRIFSLWSGLVLILIGSTIIIWLTRKRRRQQEKYLELKNQRIQENMERLEEDLNTALQNLMEKNAIVFALNDEIQKWQDKVSDTQREELSEKVNSHLLITNEGWHKFRRLFNQRFEGFLSYFETTYPDLTNAEIRIIVLMKLNLGSTEMSKALGIGVESVRKTNLRLRKKLGILDQKELKQLIDSV